MVLKKICRCNNCEGVVPVRATRRPIDAGFWGNRPIEYVTNGVEEIDIIREGTGEDLDAFYLWIAGTEQIARGFWRRNTMNPTAFVFMGDREEDLGADAHLAVLRVN